MKYSTIQAYAIRVTAADGAHLAMHDPCAIALFPLHQRKRAVEFAKELRPHLMRTTRVRVVKVAVSIEEVPSK